MLAISCQLSGKTRYAAKNRFIRDRRSFIFPWGRGRDQQWLSSAAGALTKRDGVTVTSLCPGMSDTGFAQAAKQKITFALKLLMMKPEPVVRAGIRALQAGRISVVPGWANKSAVAMIWATPRWMHQAIFARLMNG